MRKLFPLDFVVCAAGSYIENMVDRYTPPDFAEHSCIPFSDFNESRTREFLSPARLAGEAIAVNDLVEVLTEWKYVGALQGMAWILHLPGRHVSQKVKVMVDYLVCALRRTGRA